MRALFQDFFNKLFFRNEGGQTPTRIEWQTFTVCSPENLEAAVSDLKDNGWEIKAISYDRDRPFTYVLGKRERV